ncbi:MAG: hypothetical protein QW597_06450 [Thermoplasmataceae archaeon]
MLFDGDERSVYQEHSVVLDDDKRKAGTLILTNKRLVLEKVTIEKHLIGKDKKNEIIVFVTPLTEIMKADVITKRFGKPISFKITHSGHDSMFTVSDPNVWLNQILKAKSEVGMLHPSVQQPGQGYGVNINLSSPPQGVPQASSTQTIERQVIKIRCRYCGSLYDEVETKCPNCGAGR